MSNILCKLAGDFLSTILFIAAMALTSSIPIANGAAFEGAVSGSVPIATGVAIAGAVVQIVWARIRRRQLSSMTWASLALVVVLGGATLLTSDPRFVLMKPSIAHFAIGAIMLQRGWMSRYMPPIVLDNAPHLPVIAGYCWAALMFALGAGTIAVALTGDIKLWTIYVTFVAMGAKVVAFAVQYVVFRIIIRRRIIRQRSEPALPEARAV